MKSTLKYSLPYYCAAFLMCCLCLVKINTKAQNSGSVLHYKWGIEVGYGPTTTSRLNQNGRTVAWRPQIGLTHTRSIGYRNYLSYGLYYRQLATNLINNRSTNINFLSASISFNRLVLRDKILIGAGVLGDYKLREYGAVKASDGTVTKNPPPSGFNNYLSFNWGGIVTCQVPIKLSTKVSIRTGLTYSFSVQNLTAARISTFVESRPAGLWLTTGLYF